MALKATIYKAQLQIADMDRQLYADHALTLALHPSETEERLLVRLLAFALQVPKDDERGMLQFARGLSDADEPDLWQHDLSGQLVHWIEVGLPDDRRLSKACSRAERVTLYAYGAAVPVWWSGIQNRLTRLDRLEIWQLPPEQTRELAGLAQRSMQWQLTIQDGQIWLHGDNHDLEITPQRLRGPPGR
ncbi:MAG: YaeQ family protein [Rubrivivax sp.]|nr:YaeQ family protein [Rubrivivax sp.]